MVSLDRAALHRQIDVLAPTRTSTGAAANGSTQRAGGWRNSGNSGRCLTTAVWQKQPFDALREPLPVLFSSPTPLSGQALEHDRIH